MRTSTAPTPTNYADAAKILDADWTDELKIANNTTLYRASDTMICVRLHGVLLVTFHAEGWAHYRPGSHTSTTTRERLNRYAPAGVHFYLRDGVTYVSSHGRVQPLGDGVTLDAAGHVLADH